jgi:transcriptional regulator with XRE-family HTH domain
MKMTNQHTNNFAQNLLNLRTEKGVGQTQLADAIGVSKGIISLWENGLRDPTLTSLLRIAKFFDVSLDYLVGIKDY